MVNLADLLDGFEDACRYLEWAMERGTNQQIENGQASIDKIRAQILEVFG